MRRVICTAALLGVMSWTATAPAAITVLKADGSHAEPEEATITFNPDTNGWTIELLELYAPGGLTEYNIHGDAGEIIDRIAIDVPCWQGPDGECITAGSPVYVKVISDGALGINTVHEIEQTTDAEVYLLNVDVRQDVGSITAHIVGDIRAGRDMTGDIIATTPDNSIMGVYLVIAQRDILGDVLAEEGRVGLVRAYRNIGTAADPVDIRGRYYVNGVAADHDMFANVLARGNNGQAFMNVFYAERFFGSLEVDRIVPDMWVPDAPGRIIVLDEMQGNITIGGGFDNPEQWMQLPPQGFGGSIVINADNRPGESWNAPIWFGPVGDPGSIVLTGPDYTTAAALIGGGTIGVVPFDLHAESCTPVNGSAIEAIEGDLVAVELHHYGPVLANGPAPLLIERRLAGTNDPFVARPLDGFAVVVDPVRTSVLHVSANADATGFEPDHEYRFAPTTDLRCDAPDQPAVVWSETYSFTVDVAASCPSDLDGSGAVNVLDLLMVLDAWGTVGDSPADIDGDGVVSTRDLLVVLAQWGPC